MKVYYDAGLKDLAESSGGETLTSIMKCSSYKRTYQFLLQACNCTNNWVSARKEKDSNWKF